MGKACHIKHCALIAGQPYDFADAEEEQKKKQAEAQKLKLGEDLVPELPKDNMKKRRRQSFHLSVIEENSRDLKKKAGGNGRRASFFPRRMSTLSEVRQEDFV